MKHDWNDRTNELIVKTETKMYKFLVFFYAFKSLTRSEIEDQILHTLWTKDILYYCLLSWIIDVQVWLQCCVKCFSCKSMWLLTSFWYMCICNHTLNSFWSFAIWALMHEFFSISVILILNQCKDSLRHANDKSLFCPSALNAFSQTVFHTASLADGEILI